VLAVLVAVLVVVLVVVLVAIMLVVVVVIVVVPGRRGRALCVHLRSQIGSYGAD
jgi:hypothetical protein